MLSGVLLYAQIYDISNPMGEYHLEFLMSIREAITNHRFPKCTGSTPRRSYVGFVKIAQFLESSLIHTQVTQVALPFKDVQSANGFTAHFSRPSDSLAFMVAPSIFQRSFASAKALNMSLGRSDIQNHPKAH